MNDRFMVLSKKYFLDSTIIFYLLITGRFTGKLQRGAAAILRNRLLASAVILLA